MLDLVTFTVQLFDAAESTRHLTLGCSLPHDCVVAVTEYEQSTKGWTSFFQEEKRWKEATVREVMREPLSPRLNTGLV